MPACGASRSAATAVRQERTFADPKKQDFGARQQAPRARSAYMPEERDTSPLPSAGPMNADTCVSMRSGTRLYVDPMVRAAECDHAIERVADPERRVVLESLRSFWIALSDNLPFGDERGRANDLSTVTQIHTQLIANYRSAMH